tara:strand:+ start:422 stop:901 length:480 start_codon:yes stop_codon:yes gene_type:complete
MNREQAIEDAQYRAQSTGLIWHVIGYEIDGVFIHDTVSQHGIDNNDHSSLFRAVPKARKIGVLDQAVTVSSIMKELTNSVKHSYVSKGLTTPTAKGAVIGFSIFTVAETGNFGTPTTCIGANNYTWIVLFKDVNRAFKVLKMTNQIKSEYKSTKGLRPC